MLIKPKYPVGGLLLLCLLTSGIAPAHDFWIEPSSYRPEPGSELSVRLWVGDAFDGLPYRRNPPHIKEFDLIGPTITRQVTGLPGSEPAGSVRIAESGMLTIGYRSAHTMLELPANRFEAYLKEEKFTQVLQARAKNDQSGQAGREAFARYAKAILKSGNGDGQGYDRALGYALELIPEVNPYSLRPGDVLPLLILHRGKPLGNARLVARNAVNPTEAFVAYSDANGKVMIKLRRPGVWLLRSVHIVRAPLVSKADWESFWASLTFELALSVTP